MDNAEHHVASLLIIDDNPGDVYLTQRFLERSGRFAYIFSASTAEEALDMFRNYEASRAAHPGRFPPLVILLDINMPKMDGFDFLDAFAGLQASLPQATTPAVVLMLTSSNADRDRQRAASYDLIKDFIIKPISPEVAVQIADRFGVPK